MLRATAMQGGFLKLVAGALVIGALMVFAALQLIGTEANKGRLAQMAQRQTPTTPAPMPSVAPAPIPQATPDTFSQDSGWYEEANDDEEGAFSPEPFDPSPHLNDLPPEDLRFDPHPEPGVGKAQVVTPDSGPPTH